MSFFFLLPLLIQEELEEQLMRANEYLMAPSLLDKPELRDDKQRGIKKARREKKSPERGKGGSGMRVVGLWGAGGRQAQRGVTQILNY